MKKLIVFILSVMLVFSFAGCNKEEKIVIAVPDGAPALAVYNLIGESGEIAGRKYEVKIVSDSTAIAAQATSGEADVLVMPINMAAKLYNKGTDIKLASVNVFGVLYMIGKTPIEKYADLLGKVIVYTGAGGTPELTLKLILDKNNIEYVQSDEAVSGKVAISSVTAGPDAIAKLKTNVADYAVLGEPVVTQANKTVQTQVVMDLQEEWSKLVGAGSYTQAGVVLTSSVYNDEQFVSALMEKLSSNLDYLTENYASAKNVLVENGSSLKVDFTLETVQRLNIGHKTAIEAKSSLVSYMNALKEYDATLIGGKLPDDSFYYEK